MSQANKKLEKQRSVIATLRKQNKRLTKALQIIAQYDAEFDAEGNRIENLLDPVGWTQFGADSIAECIVYYVATARNALEEK